MRLAVLCLEICYDAVFVVGGKEFSIVRSKNVRELDIFKVLLIFFLNEIENWSRGDTIRLAKYTADDYRAHNSAGGLPIATCGEGGFCSFGEENILKNRVFKAYVYHYCISGVGVNVTGGDA